MTIYLYVKTHCKTGLKYLGKTVSKDPHKYRGSGLYWKEHIRVHGYIVDTEILRACQTNAEVREWGLYYSQLWNIVEARDEHGNKTWANLKEEAGEGFTSEQSICRNLKLVENGTHNFLGGEIQRRSNNKRVGDGTHNLLGGEITRQMNLKLVENGAHNFLGGKIQRQNSLKRVENGTHHFLFPTKWICPHCGKNGKGVANFNRWHGNNCGSK